MFLLGAHNRSRLPNPTKNLQCMYEYIYAMVNPFQFSRSNSAKLGPFLRYTNYFRIKVLPEHPI